MPQLFCRMAYAASRMASALSRIPYGLSLLPYALIVFPHEANADVSRVSALVANKSVVSRIYLSPGLASVLIFPCDLNEAIVGRSEDLKAEVSPTTKRQLVLHLASGASLSTNLIVRCGDSIDPFVFDIIASRVRHQDLVRIESAFGGPRAWGGDAATAAATYSREARDRELRTLILAPPKTEREFEEQEIRNIIRRRK